MPDEFHIFPNLATTPMRFFLKPMILLMRSPNSGAGAGAGAEEAEWRLTTTTTARRHSRTLILGWRYLREVWDCQHLNHFILHSHFHVSCTDAFSHRYTLPCYVLRWNADGGKVVVILLLCVSAVCLYTGPHILSTTTTQWRKWTYIVRWPQVRVWGSSPH